MISPLASVVGSFMAPFIAVLSIDLLHLIVHLSSMHILSISAIEVAPSR